MHALIKVKVKITNKGYIHQQNEYYFLHEIRIISNRIEITEKLLFTAGLQPMMIMVMVMLK